MKKPKSKQVNIGLIPATLILAAITLAFILLVNRTSQQATINKVASPVVQSSPAIKNTADLDAAIKELDSSDPSTFDQDLNTLNVDSSSF